MRVIRYDAAEGAMRLAPETLEDLWHLERVLEPGDAVSGASMRRFKATEGESGEKKAIKVTLAAERIELHRHANRLRITGRIVSGSPEEYVQIGSYHTLDVEQGTAITITKRWKEYQIRRLKEAQREGKKPAVAVLVLDDEKATLALVRGYGIDVRMELESRVSKRDERREEMRKQYFAELAKVLEAQQTPHLIVAGPGFTKDNFRKYLEAKAPELLARVRFASCSNAERSGVYELLRRGVVSEILGELRFEKEMRLIDAFIAEASKDGLAAYGKAEVGKAIEMAAVEHLLILDELLRKERWAEALLEGAEKARAKMTIFSAENEAGEKLAGFGGVAALLRFRIE